MDASNGPMDASNDPMDQIVSRPSIFETLLDGSMYDVLVLKLLLVLDSLTHV